jgi:LmbE family N-acetylglucosaminyl deacetylase
MRHLSSSRDPLKLVCPAARPDEIEIAAGATLPRLAERGGVQGHWLTLTGSPEQRAEAEAAAEAFLSGSSWLPRIPRRAASTSLE